MGNALFIVWRESAEAMLVVGILYAWLKHRPDAATGMRFLWGGVAAGAGAGARACARHAGHRLVAVRQRPRLFPARDHARRVGADRADGVLDAPAWPHVQEGSRGEHGAQCARGELVGPADRRRARGRLAKRRRRSSSSTGSARKRAASPICRSCWCSASAAAFATFWLLQQGSRILTLARVLPRERDPVAAARRRAARFRHRKADRARCRAGARRSGVEYVAPARRFGPARRPDRLVHRLPRAAGAAAAAGAGRVLDRSFALLLNRSGRAAPAPASAPAKPASPVEGLPRAGRN